MVKTPRNPHRTSVRTGRLPGTSKYHIWRLEFQHKNFGQTQTFGSLHLRIYPRHMKTYVHTETYTWMFITALFIITPNWKQSKCPSTCEYMNKMWYIYTMEYCLTMKRNERATIWTNLKKMMLSTKKSEGERLYIIGFNSYEIFRKGKLMEKESRSMIADG